MPPLTRWCIRASLLYLVGGMAMGSWMLISQAVNGYGPGGPWGEIHAHVLLVGFLLLMIFGVAFWMFPRVKGQRPRHEWGWLAFWLINAGLLLRVLAQPLAEGGDDAVGWRVLVGIAAVLPVLGVLAFAVSVWPRVRATMTADEAREIRQRSAAGR